MPATGTKTCDRCHLPTAFPILIRDALRTGNPDDTRLYCANCADEWRSLGEILPRRAARLATAFDSSLNEVVAAFQLTGRERGELAVTVQALVDDPEAIARADAQSDSEGSVPPPDPSEAPPGDPDGRLLAAVQAAVEAFALAYVQPDPDRSVGEAVEAIVEDIVDELIERTN